jgi:hypothetical protein
VRPSLETMARRGLWPTPTVNGNYNRSEYPSSGGDGLATAVNRWPTPTVWDGAGKPNTAPEGGPNLSTVVGGQLNPMWVEWLMGFPLGWTDLEDSETP